MCVAFASRSPEHADGASARVRISSLAPSTPANRVPRVSVQLIALLTNLSLALLKFVVGTLAGSRALIADAFNSAGDVVATFVAWLAFRYGRRPPDDDHHYGHQNAEALGGLLLGGMLTATGCFICVEGVVGMSQDRPPQAPGEAAIWAALATALIKAVLYTVSVRVGTRQRSPTLLASARDHGADVVAGLVALAGIWIARHGYPRFDAFAGIAIGIYITWLSVKPLRDNTAILMHAAPPDMAEQAGRLAGAVAGVRSVHRVRVQPLGGFYRLDMSVGVDGSLSVREAHGIAHLVEDRIREATPDITEVHVHLEPSPGDHAAGS